MSVNPKRLAEKEKSQSFGAAVVMFDADKGCWLLPGGRKVFSENQAMSYAVRINALMLSGQKFRGTGISRVCK